MIFRRNQKAKRPPVAEGRFVSRKCAQPGPTMRAALLSLSAVRTVPIGSLRTASDRACGKNVGNPQTTRHIHSAPLNGEKPRLAGLFTSGRYWARTSDLRLVEAALSQLS
jgi:hypothetical protein